MLTAVNSIKLILLIILGFVFLVGQGWLVIGPLLHGSLLKRKNEISYFQELFLIIISGLIINYGMVLIIHSLKTSIILGSILAIIGVCFYLLMLFRTIKRNRLTTISYIKLFGVIIICTLFIGPILVLPISDWDARSIWFLHAKMIYFAGTFGKDIGWLHPSVFFSHTDYPNLIPTLAAQVAYTMGYWNEYLPKLSLLFLLVPAISLLFTFYRRSFSFLFLIIIIPISFSSKLWNGYMDGYLSFYFALFLLQLGRFYKYSKTTDLISSVLSLIILLYLKNEGGLAVIAGICAILLTLLIKKYKISIKIIFANYWKYLLALFILLIPFGLWNIYKSQWGLANDLGLGSNQSIMQFMNRFTDGSFNLVIARVHEQLAGGIMLFGFLLLVTIIFKIRTPRVIFPVLVASGVYSLGMIVIYMATPLRLIEHLNDSVDRTMLTVAISLFVACFYLVSNLEKNEDNQ